jgi:hypothetical protein
LQIIYLFASNEENRKEDIFIGCRFEKEKISDKE